MESPSAQWLLCFDFDGTFIDPEQPTTVDPALAAILEQLREKGAAIAINTGRSLPQAVSGINACRLREIPDYLIAWERELYEPTKFRRWVDFGKWNKRCRKEHKKLFKSHRKLLAATQEFVEEHSGAKWIAEPEEPAGIIARDDAEMDHLCAFIDHELRKADIQLLSYERNSIYLRFAHARYNKGTTLAELARNLDVPRERIFAAGDNHNDMTMLGGDVAGMVGCPSNAVPEVKQQVTDAGGHVASLPAGAGTAEALQAFFS